MKSAVLIHKSPASWNKANLADIDAGNTISGLFDTYPKFTTSEVFHDMHEADIYYRIFIGLCKELEIDEIHVVQAFDNNEVRNYSTERKNGHFKVGNVNFWSIDNISDICCFFRCDFLMTRGQYPKFHEQMIPLRRERGGCWIHYPATAQHYPWFELVAESWKQEINEDYPSVSKKIIEFLEVQKGAAWKPVKLRSLQGIHSSIIDSITDVVIKQRLMLSCNAYDILLIDDEYSIPEKARCFPNSIPITFLKPCFLTNTNSINHQRDIDLIFCGTTLVPTKNHPALLQILNDLDKLGNRRKICIVGDEGSMPEFTNHTKSHFANIVVDNIGLVRRSELLSLFSRSKTCLVLSGRDCNPRIISEATTHGCRVLAVNTLSDGFEVIRNYPLIGKIIDTPLSSFRYDSKTSPSPDVNGLALKIEKEIECSTYPDSTKRLASLLFDLDGSISKIYSAIKILL